MTAGASSGCEGWAWDDVLPYFRRSQHQERGACEIHGVGGPLNVSDPTTGHEVSEAVIEACEALGLPHRDPNGAEQEGVGWYQVTIKDGKRCSAAVAYLHPAMERPNLQVETRALAQPDPVRRQARGRGGVRPERREEGGPGERRGDPGRRRDQFAPAAPAFRNRPGRLAARARHRNRRRPSGRRREPPGPFRHRRDLPAEEGHRLGQRARPGHPLPQGDAQIYVRQEGPAHPLRRPCRRLLQVARGPRRARHPVPHPARDDGPGQARQRPEDGAGEGARPHHRALPAPPGIARNDPDQVARSRRPIRRSSPIICPTGSTRK